ncbi:MarR family transcriptional regulator [Microaerobacter geothermalis]|uniref:MarR family winged helix-turn-helix transcriptional regulator n=1 Tax=Microaerobacter geothermalis TaxID=674972 RepID=UPI001F2255DB|nr:MarR family transcriptional regulator [Microaerobacter geothermalis]MCF6093539.1 MarR family transcriptional regulator [Microaerobacter geothermalis]
MDKKGETQRIHEILNYFRAVDVVIKEDWDKEAKKLSLDSSIQLNILWIVYCFEGVRITQIAEWTFWHPSSIVIHVKKLMEKGLVEIDKRDTDGRVVNVFLTGKGKEIIFASRDSAPSAFRVVKAMEELEKRYSPGVRQLFFECLRFLAEELHGVERVDWVNQSRETIDALDEMKNYCKN